MAADGQMLSWNMALIQCNIALGDPKRNREKIGEALERAASSPLKPDVIVLPEMWNTGYALTAIHQLADPDGAESRALISAFAKRYGIHVVAGSIARSQGGKVFNTMQVYDRYGEEIASYSKIHLFRLMEEQKYLAPGGQSVIFELDGVMAGASICYDIRFPELARTLALKGARVLFVPAEWPYPRLNHWRTLLTARAIENQMFVIACNRIGSDGDDSFFGHSLIIDPWGEIVSEGGEGEEIVTGTVDLSLADQVRSLIPVFDDRRPKLYDL